MKYKIKVLKELDHPCAGEWRRRIDYRIQLKDRNPVNEYNCLYRLHTVAKFEDINEAKDLHKVTDKLAQLRKSHPTNTYYLKRIEINTITKKTEIEVTSE